MDTKSLIADSKARFNHNSAKAQLKDKYDGRLVIADQGGLWKATPETIAFLSYMDTETVILADTFDNLVEVDRAPLLQKLRELYSSVMSEWHKEWKAIESKR